MFCRIYFAKELSFLILVNRKCLIMDKYLFRYIFWIISIIAGIIATFLIFGVELPLYLGIGGISLMLFIFSENPLVRYISGWTANIFLSLFLIALIYYTSGKVFLPDNPFEFRFFFFGLNILSQTPVAIGNFVKYLLSLI